MIPTYFGTKKSVTKKRSGITAYFGITVIWSLDCMFHLVIIIKTVQEILIAIKAISVMSMFLLFDL